jgi:tRNA nucleotidyltransferase (CCA-adding enzyme)
VSDQEQIPSWAIELIKQVERLNEKIPTHVEWVERNLKDHENRIRTLEQFRWMVVGMVGLSGVLGAFIGKLLGI